MPCWEHKQEEQLEELKDRLRIMWEALDFYADEFNYREVPTVEPGVLPSIPPGFEPTHPAILDDRGKKARVALGMEEG